MIAITVLLHMFHVQSTRLRDARDTGAVSLEQVIISLGLFGLAIAVVGAIGAYVNGHLKFQ